MEINKDILNKTISEFSKGRKDLLISEYTQIIDNDEIKELQMKEIENVIEYALDKDFDKLLTSFRNTEYDQSYKYSALFKIINKDVGELLSVLEEKRNLKINENDYFGHYNSEKRYFILNFFRRGTTLVGNEAITKERIQSAIIVLHEVDKELYFEVSVDSIQNYYRKDSTNYYLSIIDRIVNWISQKLLITCQPVNLNFTIDKMRKNQESDFLVSAQLMNTNNGAKATLDSASSTTIILPILGELKELIATNKNLFKNSEEGLEKINDFIIELEEESDLPWVSLINKTKKISIKFLFESYTGKDYTLLNYYYHEKKREGMDYVTRKLLSEYNQVNIAKNKSEETSLSGI
ncbi:hypothetical protein [Staphylococcus aureus]|uniref:hypothetical protein n=1 Tax=Staphylococcus aureus TaxID=1280 RepID=UPI003F146EE5